MVSLCTDVLYSSCANMPLCTAAVADLPDQDVINILEPTQVKLKEPRTGTKS